MNHPGGKLLTIYFTHQLLTNVQIADTHSENAASHSSAKPFRGSTMSIVSRYHLPATRPMRTTSCRTPSFARSGRGTRTCPAATAAAGYSRSAGTCSCDRANARARLWSSRPPRSTGDCCALSYIVATKEALDDMLARLDLAPAIEHALANVPEPFRSTLIIVDVEDQSYESAAESAGRSDRYGAVAAVPWSSPDAGAIAHRRDGCGLWPTPSGGAAFIKCQRLSAGQFRSSAFTCSSTCGTTSTADSHHGRRRRCSCTWLSAANVMTIQISNSASYKRSRRSVCASVRRGI